MTTPFVAMTSGYSYDNLSFSGHFKVVARQIATPPGETIQMRYPAFVLSALALSASLATAQTGFTTRTYSAILSSNDNNQLLSADFNGDGYPDLFSWGSRYQLSTVSGNILLNNSSGGFAAPVALPGSGILGGAAIGDMNGDGYPDIVGCQNSGSGQSLTVNVIVYLNQGNGTFKALPAVSASGQCNAMTVGNVLNTGHLDVVTSGQVPGQYGPDGTFYPQISTTIDTFRNDGTGTLTSQGEELAVLDKPNTTSGDYTNCGGVGMVGGDFQQNGSFDLLITTSCQPVGENLPGYEGTTYYFPNNQNGQPGTFGLTYLQSQNELYTNGRVVDLEGNGVLDVLFTGTENGYTGDLIFARNNGGGAFTFTKELTSTYFEGATAADFNGDGLGDLITAYDTKTSANTPAPPMISILSGVKGGGFTDSQDFTIGSAASLGGGIVAADFNGDGKPDMATLIYDTNSRTTSLNVYLNTQGGSSTACAAPTRTDTNIICSPASGATLNSPVTVNAASNVPGFTLNRLYLDNTSVYQTTSQNVSTPITAGPGTHDLVLVSYDNTGKAYTSSVSFTVGTATGSGCIPNNPGVSICSPVSGQTYNGQITITSGARAQNGYITAMRVYMDNTAVFTSYNPSQTATYDFTQNLGVIPGNHNLVMIAYESTGAAEMNSVSFYTPPQPCTPPAQGFELNLCTPYSIVTNTSPIDVQAAATAGTGNTIAAIRIYVDNATVATLFNSGNSQTFTINQPVPISSGRHYLALVAWDNTGTAATSTEYVTVK
jgi:FG-GAP-like repeat